ncbi:hypothetical protein EET67_19145 [Pseudaminobacter arsenicus]|uniref:NodB homology domain-containing protein n=1 Tax=Borborobacter arsenicus TaxID=1851146 RepID=A0A432V280_9HYPH|nr:hypothetical protein [Pseudaminobacter arsenicus]RUM96280.1 hypothetical protein EET67_19145 [Pseudaminobacter arsenicus]
MIHFLLEGLPLESFNTISHAAFELGCRLNTRFSIHRAASTVPSGGIVVSYGDADAAAVVVPISPKPGAPIQVDDRWLYASPADTPDIFQGTADLLEFRHESRMGRSRDKMGRIGPAANPLTPWLREPLIENNAEYLKRLIEKHGATVPQVSTPFGEGQYAVCITHDVDGPRLHSWFALGRSLAYALKGDKYERESFELGLLTKVLRRPDPYWSFEFWQELEQSYGARSTFLFYMGELPAASRHARDPHYNPLKGRFRATMHLLKDTGWEVGPHIGINGHSVDGYKQSIERVHNLCWRRPVSVRTHYWSGMQHPLSAWKNMDEAGLKTDASLSPQAIGYRGGAMMPVLPSYRWRSDLDGIVAMPTPIMDAYIVPRSSGLSRSESRAQATQILDNARRFGGLVVLDWHARTLCNAGAWKGYMAPLVEILNAVKADGSAKFMTMAEVGDAWREHAKRCFVGEAA